jgi:hypothetical protein
MIPGIATKSGMRSDGGDDAAIAPGILRSWLVGLHGVAPSSAIGVLPSRRLRLRRGLAVLRLFVRGGRYAGSAPRLRPRAGAGAPGDRVLQTAQDVADTWGQ